MDSTDTEQSTDIIEKVKRIVDIGDGYLPSEYCGDQEAQGIHFTDAACELWVKYLRENV